MGNEILLGEKKKLENLLKSQKQDYAELRRSLTAESSKLKSQNLSYAAQIEEMMAKMDGYDQEIYSAVD